MNDLSGRKLQEFRTWRRDDGDLKPVTLEGNLDALRVFIRWCESIDAVAQGLHEKIIMPTLSKEDEQAEAVLEYLRQYEYATRGHAIIELLWHTGIRLGALHSLDPKDYDSERETLALRHRPETRTALKNGMEGERIVALNGNVCSVIEGYIEHNRPESRDDSGRKPLLTSRYGRLSRTNVRETVYKITRPCYYGVECPRERDPDTCEGTHYDSYSKCPVNVSPHDIRRGSITNHLSEDVPEKVVSDRMNVGPDVLDKHYDKRTEEQKTEARRGYIEGV
jgi:integrase